MEITLRTLENNIEFLKKHLEKSKVKTSRILVSREYGSENKNEHYHYYLQISHGNQKDESIIRSIRRQLYKHYKTTNYYVKKVKDTKKLLIYITKDGDIVANEGFTEDEINKLAEQNELIEKDKQLPVYQKIYNRIVEYTLEGEEKALNTLAVDRRWIIKRIIMIYKEWDKPPPSKTIMFQYVNYIQQKAGLDDIVVENYM